MDPDAALAEMREGTIAYLGSEAGTPAHDLAAARVVEASQALDSWLTGGGFPPKAWYPKERI